MFEFIRKTNDEAQRHASPLAMVLAASAILTCLVGFIVSNPNAAVLVSNAAQAEFVGPDQPTATDPVQLAVAGKLK
jgi:hypothetical protein